MSETGEEKLLGMDNGMSSVLTCASKVSTLTGTVGTSSVGHHWLFGLAPGALERFAGQRVEPEQAQPELQEHPKHLLHIIYHPWLD